MAFKKWQVGAVDKEAAKELAELCDADGLVTLIAMSRGIDTPENLDEFLSEDAVLADPFSLAGMYDAAQRIRQAMEKGEKITVFGDYDCDGVTATAIVYRYLTSRNARVDYYIPAREGEGYGMSAQAVERLHETGTQLIITVDNGIRAIEEIAYAASLGIDTVVTDHHVPGEELPKCAALVDPHLPYCTAELTELSGAGVALMLISAVEGVQTEEMLAEYSALAALGTVADVVPLLSANRVIVREGLLAINAGSEPALSALYAAAAGKLPVTAENLAFILAPRINAAGRMGDAAVALQLLITNDGEEMANISHRLCELNTLRRTTEQEILAEATAKAEAEGYCFDRIVVVEGEGWHPGVVGIVASCLVEKYGRPALVLSGENGVFTGSGRSVEGFDLIAALSRCEDLFEKYGGHSGAAGLTVKAENLDEFRRRINRYATETDMPVPALNIDCKLNPAAVNVGLAQRLSQLEPFGAGNPTPLFGLYGMNITRIDGVSENRHTRITAEKGGFAVSCMLFSVSPENVGFSSGEVVDLAVNISVSYYKGAPNLSMIARAIRLAGCDGERLAKDMRPYEDYRRGSATADIISEIIPQREEIGNVWRIIKTCPNICFEKLLCKSPLNASKTAIARDVLLELGLISGDEKYLIDPSAKADLAQSQILKSAQVMI